MSMSRDEIRMRCLELARPDNITNPDASVIIARAKEFEAYVNGPGQAQQAPASTPAQGQMKPGQGQSAPGTKR